MCFTLGLTVEGPRQIVTDLITQWKKDQKFQMHRSCDYQTEWTRASKSKGEKTINKVRKTNKDLVI